MSFYIKLYPNGFNHAPKYKCGTPNKSYGEDVIEVYESSHMDNLLLFDTEGQANRMAEGLSCPFTIEEA